MVYCVVVMMDVLLVCGEIFVYFWLLSVDDVLMWKCVCEVLMCDF